MNESLAKRVRAAAGAGWCTFVIGAIWLTLGYAVFLVLMHYRPGWALWLWGGGGNLTWDDFQKIALPLYGVFKLMIFVVALASLWLSLWARRLRKG